MSTQYIADPDIEAAVAKDNEGKVFEHFSVQKIGREWAVSIDYYTVKDGQVFIIEGDKLTASGDTNWSLHLECVQIGYYHPNQSYERQIRFIEYGRLKELLHLASI